MRRMKQEDVVTTDKSEDGGTKKDSERRFMASFCRGTEVCQHIKCCLLLAIGGCGEASLAMAFDKALDDDVSDMHFYDNNNCVYV